MAEVQEFVPQGFEGAHMVSLKSQVSIAPSLLFVVRGCFLRIKTPWTPGSLHFKLPLGKPPTISTITTAVLERLPEITRW